MNPPPDAEHAVSEIIGALILISVIVAGFAIVGVMMFSQPQPQKIPALNAIISTNTQTVNLYHNGGDSFLVEDVQLLLNGQDLTSSFKQDGSSGWSTWSVGQSLTYDVPPGNPVPSLIQIVYKGGGVSHLIASNGEGSPGGGNLPVPAPVVTAITPNSGVVGTVVSITNLAGLNFFNGATVKLTRAGYADIPASSVVVDSSSQITCAFNLAGAATGAWNVVVTNPDGPSGTLANGFTVVAAIAPVAAFTGTPLTGPIPLTVSFTDQSANIPTSWYWNFGDGQYSSLQNPTNTYASAGNYSVSLTATNAWGSNITLKPGYIFTYVPAVANFTGTPRSGPASLTVFFTDLSTGSPFSFFWQFGDIAIVNTSIAQNPGHTYDTIGLYSVNLTVANSFSSSSLVRTGYINVTTPPPTAYIINTTPTSGLPPFTVSWLGLSSNAPILSWLWDFGDGSPLVTTQSATHTFSSSGTYNVSLTATNAGGSGTAYQLITVYYTPTFTSITPGSGSTLGGTPVTIAGTNFADGGAFGVTIGGNPSTSVVRVNSTHITAVTPAGTVGAKNVVITNNGGQTATGTGAYTYVALPTFTSITPVSGPPAGGTAVTIVGTNFVSGGLFGVTIGGFPATSVVRVNATYITAVTPAGTLGARNVVVTNNDGQTATGTGAFTYITPPPTFTTITPSSGPTAGGTPVTIVGGNFVSGGSFGVTIGGVAATSVVLVDSSHITAVTPAGTAGARNVVITNNDGQTATGTGAYTYVAPPTFTGITPNTGTSAGGKPVTITGGNFVSGGSFGVTIGGVAATSVVRVDASTITAVTPAGTVGPRNVVITNNDGQTATGAGAYTYYTILSFTSVGTTSWTVPSGVTTVQYLVVAGGGGGGRYGGGGGAGGFRTGTLTGLSGSQTVTIGDGGAGATSSTARGSNGGISVFASVTATGGGGGGSSGASGVYSGATGGSGGGGARSGGAGGSGTSGQGNNGGAGARTSSFTGGGGGGAGAVGGTASTSTAGSGGAGTASSITDLSVTYAGGGGGGCNSARTAGGGSAGGGGAGGDGVAGTNGTNGLGGGGGGSGTATTTAGRGGSGIVIIKFY